MRPPPPRLYSVNADAEDALPHGHVADLVDEDERRGEQVVVGADLADQAGVGTLGRDLDLQGQAHEVVAGGRVGEVVVVARRRRGGPALLHDGDLRVAVPLAVAPELRRGGGRAGREAGALEAVAVRGDRVVLQQRGGGEDLQVRAFGARQRGPARQRGQGRTGHAGRARGGEHEGAAVGGRRVSHAPPPPRPTSG